MRRYIAVLFALILCLLSAEAKVLRRASLTVTPVSANLLDETFTGAGYSDADWTESGTGILDEDEATNCGSGTGWSGDCLEINLANSETGKTTNAFAAQTGDVWVKARMKINYTLGFDGNSVQILGLSDAVGGETAGSLRIQIARFTGPVYEISVQNPASGELSFATAPATGSTVCLELYMNNTNNNWQWWIGGVSQGSGNTANIAIDPTNLWMPTRDMGSATSVIIYVDNVQVSNTGRMTCS